MKERFVPILLITMTLSACNEQRDTSDASQVSGRSFSVIGALRPKADPEVMRKIQEEEFAAERARQAELARQNAENQGQYDDPSARNLPGVNTSPLADIPMANTPSPSSGSSSGGSWAPVPPAPPGAASYSSNYGSPSAGFVPPPPAISLSTAAQTLPFGAPPQPDMYSNPYAYANPYAQAQPPAPVQRPSGSLFGSGQSSRNNEASEESYRKPKADKNLVVITPTGMEPRSPYKQRDDLRLLWKGTLSGSLGRISRGAELEKLDVNLPGETSKGSLSVSQRQSDHLFKNAAVDRKIVAQVKKAQTELIQAYYRYLYAFNKFSLTQQNVAARKQELEFADSQSEKQRAAADLAQAQNDAEASKDDMRSAQNDLASVAGVQSARTVIGRVCGVTPSLDSLASAESGEEQKAEDKSASGFFNSFGSAFGMGKGKGKEVASAEDAKEKPVKSKEEKSKKKEKNKQVAVRETGEPPAKAASNAETTTTVTNLVAHGAVSFELKDVKTTPRKSILRVAIRNNGSETFSFDVDHLSVAEGNSRLAEAAVNAEFDTTSLEPNQEITGTITIFGRPWNDKLTVSLTDGGKAIVMRR